MKRFILSILFVSVFCIGLGTLVDTVGAKFKSDEKALALIRDARQAIGGDSAIAGIKSMTIIGQTTKTFKTDGGERSEQGVTEINMQLPDKLMKMVTMDRHEGDAAGGEDKRIDFVVVGDAKEGNKAFATGQGKGVGSEPAQQRVVIRTSDGKTGDMKGAEAGRVGDPNAGGTLIRKIDGDKTVFSAEDEKNVTSDGKHIMIDRVGGEGHHGAMRHNELLRLTLGLLLTAPDAMEVNYTYGGESDVDGTACNIVVAEFGGSAFKLYLGKSSNLPVMMSYSGIRMPQVFSFRTKDPKTGGDTKSNVIFTRKIEGPPEETAVYNVKFSDYRVVAGVQLPFRWTQTVGTTHDETFDVTSYELNPANIADKFQNQKVMIRTKKPDGQ